MTADSFADEMAAVGLPVAQFQKIAGANSCDPYAWVGR